VNVYTKPHLSFSDQVKLLESRGLHVGDSDEAASLLSVIGCYRLSGYWYPYRRTVPGEVGRDDRFIDGATFEQVTRLYNADRRLKLLVLAAI
jgi:abortive infection bacteriophage resistance protein